VRKQQAIKELLALNEVDRSWQEILLSALLNLEDSYLERLLEDKSYLPRAKKIFAAFKSLKLESTRYILFGQDPYPRAESATGYAFIDGRVEEIFCAKGLSKEVNRATSLRNFIKMALVARGSLSLEDLSQEAIAALDKRELITTIDELRKNFEASGVLLLNMALIFTKKEESRRHIYAWRGFIDGVLDALVEHKPTLILFGAYAKKIQERSSTKNLPSIAMEHPYNNSFIGNKRALELFGDMDLLLKR